MSDNIFRIRINPKIKAKYQEITSTEVRDEIRRDFKNRVDRAHAKAFPEKVNNLNIKRSRQDNEKKVNHQHEVQGPNDNEDRKPCPYCYRLTPFTNDLDERLTNPELQGEKFEVICEYCKKLIIGSC